MEVVPTDRQILIESNQGNMFCAKWVKNPYTNKVAWIIASYGDDGEQLIVEEQDAIAWQYLPKSSKNN